MIRKIGAIILGVLVLNVIAASGIIASRVALPSVAHFIGCFVAGFIARKSGLIYGALVSIGSFLFLIFSLICIAYKASGGSLFFPKIALLYPNLFAIIFGLLGGHLGEKLYIWSKRIRT